MTLLTTSEPATSSDEPAFAPDVDFASNVAVAGITASIVSFVPSSVAVPPTYARFVMSTRFTATAMPMPFEPELTADPSASTVDLFLDEALTFCSPVVVIVRPVLSMCASVGANR